MKEDPASSHPQHTQIPESDFRSHRNQTTVSYLDGKRQKNLISWPQYLTVHAFSADAVVKNDIASFE